MKVEVYFKQDGGLASPLTIERVEQIVHAGEFLEFRCAGDGPWVCVAKSEIQAYYQFKEEAKS